MLKKLESYTGIDDDGIRIHAFLTSWGEICAIMHSLPVGAAGGSLHSRRGRLDVPAFLLQPRARSRVAR